MNIRSIYLAGLFAIIGSHIINTNAQQLRNPFDFPILLSGNFGELRSNHFHSGIDFKTQGVEGKPVHTVQEGYVSRISVSPWGYGNGLYITHPDGTTTVYGHLQKFSKKIANYVKEQQYAQESFNVNLFLTPDLLPVEKNEVVALSGNTGSSGGPHLHFEVRDTDTEEVMDPLDYFSDRITDTRPPKIQGIQIVPIEGKGVVNGKSKKLEIKPVTAKNGKQTITGKIEAWGEIGLAVKAYDYMDNTTNIYGVREITLTADSQVIFHSNLDKFAFDETRYLNTFTDYEEWKDHRSFYMRSFIEPGNRLRFLESVNRGILRIDEPRFYNTVFFNGRQWPVSCNQVLFYNGGNSGVQEGQATLTGYMLFKRFNRSVSLTNPGVASQFRPSIIFRLADFYLMYAEAANEVNPNDARVLKYLNLVRERAGLPDIETLNPAIRGNQELQRAAIQRERQIELATEGQRYFDVRRWMIADKNGEGRQNGYVHGMNVRGESNDKEDFNRIVEASQIVFNRKMYLYPMPDSEMRKTKNLVQNPGW